MTAKKEMLQCAGAHVSEVSLVLLLIVPWRWRGQCLLSTAARAHLAGVGSDQSQAAIPAHTTKHSTTAPYQLALTRAARWNPPPENSPESPSAKRGCARLKKNKAAITWPFSLVILLLYPSLSFLLALLETLDSVSRQSRQSTGPRSPFQARATRRKLPLNAPHQQQQQQQPPPPAAKKDDGHHGKAQ